MKIEIFNDYESRVIHKYKTNAVMHVPRKDEVLKIKDNQFIVKEVQHIFDISSEYDEPYLQILVKLDY